MPKTYSLDLHKLGLKDEPNPQDVIYRKLDQFITPLLKKQDIQIEIIVGRGHNSRTFIDGMPVLRYYTYQYLNMLHLEPRYYPDYGKFMILNY
jgi:hypothetical protein